MLRRSKHRKDEVVAPKEEEEKGKKVHIRTHLNALYLSTFDMWPKSLEI